MLFFRNEPFALHGRPVRGTCLTLAGLHVVSALAGPEGMTVLSGTASAASAGPNLTIHASDGAFLAWRTFNIAPGQTTRFVQPDAASVVWNRIDDPNPSRLFGTLQANGIVVLSNPSGFWFGPDCFVKAGGFVATTTPIAPPDFSASSPWNLAYAPPKASIINYGQIQVSPGGSAFLIAEHVENHGTVSAPEGEIGLLAGREVLLSERPDGRGLSARVRLPAGSVDNHGRLVADAGTIALQAQVVNQNGVVQANSARERNGVIELVATDLVSLGARSVLRADGDPVAPGSPGGRIHVESSGSYADTTGSRISAAGQAAGGAGGEIHLSAAHLPALRSELGAAGGSGAAAGRLVIDPTDIILSDTGGGGASGGSVGQESPPDTLRLDVGTQFAGFSQITLQARRDITLERAWNLGSATGIDTADCRLELQAGRDIRLKDPGALDAGEHWSVSLAAGYDFTTATVKPGEGAIRLEGTSSIQAGRGSIHLAAGKDVQVASGFVHTTAGGSIRVDALAGSVNTGTRTAGFRFTTVGEGYEVDRLGLGGISTAAGGDVLINAGGDIRSYLPTLAGSHGDGGSGAFGAEPGDVTITAGGNVFGHYVVRNGTGRIQAVGDAGRLNQMLALSLVRGSWTVEAAGVALQEVRNPNGIFNKSGFSTSPTRHRFDYDAAAEVLLRARGEVQLLGLALPRNAGNAEALPPIYPPTLAVEAGAGGIVLGNHLTLFPSATGGLALQTIDGGPLRTSRAGLALSLIMSDSDSRRYTSASDFGPFTHGAELLHELDSDPVRIDISGSVSDLLLAVPKAAQLRVGGDLVNTSFLGQNLKPSDVTALEVSGRILNRNNYSFLLIDPTAEREPDLDTLIFAVNQPEVSAVDSLLPRFFYNPLTHRLGFQGRMTDRDLAALLNLQVKTRLNGVPLPLNEAGQFITEPGVLMAEARLRELFAASQDVPDVAPEGYQLGGPGSFQIKAAALDLGVTKGVISAGAKYNPALARVSSQGADLQLDLTTGLSMFASSIRCVSGGNIVVRAGGGINVGDPDLPGNPEVARGIYTVGGSDVTVLAGEDVLVNGSRIAAYDGGNVHVRSEHGNVDAGVGALGFVRVERLIINPVSADVTSVTRAIPGSGILATTFPGSDRALGDIRVETPAGNILANNGGIVQISLNGVESTTARVVLKAGTKTPGGAPDGTDLIVKGNIEAGASGVIGGNIEAEATGDISGVLIARNNISIDARQNANVTAVASGTASLSAGSLSGTVVAIGGIDAAGSGSVTANLISQNVSGSSSGQVGFTSVSVASASQQRAETAEDTKQLASASRSEEDEDRRRRASKPVLSRTVGRVTVVLPKN